MAGGGKFANGAVTGAFGYLTSPEFQNDVAYGSASDSAVPKKYQSCGGDLGCIANRQNAIEPSDDILYLLGGGGVGALRSWTVAAVDHIVLGIASYGLDDLAASIGGRTLMGAGAGWRYDFLAAVGNQSTRFTVNLDGFSGATTFDQVMGAAMRGSLAGARNTEWEMGILYQSQRLPTTTFMRGGQVVPNPFR